MPSTEKVFATDLTAPAPPSEQALELAFQDARARIMTGFASSLPNVVAGYVDLATNPEVDPDVRRKASDRILDTFVPTQGKMERVGNTTIQILNALPVPEVRAIDGRESTVVEIGEVKYALPVSQKRLIKPAPADAQKRRSQFLGPVVPGTTKFGVPNVDAKSPSPEESLTPMKKL